MSTIELFIGAVSIICQNKNKNKTDQKYIKRTFEQNKNSPDKEL